MDLVNLLKGKELVILDLDGTLARLNIRWDDLKKELEGYVKIKKNVAISFSPLNQGLKKSKQEYGEELLKELYKIIENYEHENLHYIVPNLDLIKIIKSTDRKFAILSDNLTSTIKFVLRNLDIEKQISFIIGKDSISNYKPHIDGIKKVLDHYDTKESKKVVYIGDTEIDNEISVRAGIEFIKIKMEDETIG